MDDDKAELRKNEDDLYVSGVGSIAVGVWSFVKLIMEIIAESRDTQGMSQSDIEETMLIYVIVAAVLIALFIVIFKVHYYVGVNAIRAAKGGDYKKGYYKAAVVMLALNFLSLASYWDIEQYRGNLDTTIASMLVDLTTIYIFATVIISTQKIRHLKERQPRE